MESTNSNFARVGNFTSSEIHLLMGAPKPKAAYIEECNIERRLNRSITSETTARPTTWGNFVEKRVLTMLGIRYKECSFETITHETIDYWSGSPDSLKEDEGRTVCDVKCPYTLKSFVQLAQPLYDGLSGIEAMNALRDNHKDGEKYYWQLVSNAILSKSKFAELIVYAPHLSELEIIRDATSDFDGDQNAVAWINWAKDEELPYLIDGGYYKNLNVIRFEVPQSDKDLLTEKVKEAGKLLIPRIPLPEIKEIVSEVEYNRQKSYLSFTN